MSVFSNNEQLHFFHLAGIMSRNNRYRMNNSCQITWTTFDMLKTWKKF